MDELTVDVVLKEIQQMKGIGVEMIAVEVAVVLPNQLVFKSQTNIIVNIMLETVLEGEIKVTQRLSVDNIIIENEERLLPLEGTLWFMGKSNTTNILAASAKIYYCSAI